MDSWPSLVETSRPSPSCVQSIVQTSAGNSASHSPSTCWGAGSLAVSRRFPPPAASAPPRRPSRRRSVVTTTLWCRRGTVALGEEASGCTKRRLPAQAADGSHFVQSDP